MKFDWVYHEGRGGKPSETFLHKVYRSTGEARLAEEQLLNLTWRRAKNSPSHCAVGAMPVRDCDFGGSNRDVQTCSVPEFVVSMY